MIKLAIGQRWWGFAALLGFFGRLEARVATLIVYLSIDAWHIVTSEAICR